MIDEFVAELAAGLRCSGRRRDRIVEEVRDHLGDAVASFESRGVKPGVARERAVGAFGPASDLALQFNTDIATAEMRRTPVVVAVSAIAVVGGFLLAVLTQPQPAAPASAGVVVQVAFFVAVIGLQTAVVAGARAASLVAARWRAMTTVAAERRIVRDAAVVCVAALGVAAVAWTTTLLVVIGNRPQIRAVPLDAGIAAMLSAALIAAAALARRSRIETNGAPEADTEPGGIVLGLGERVIDGVRRRPTSACFVVAVVAGLLAMSRAETTVAGAIPFGCSEALAVVAAFVVLGPRLGLRDSSRSRVFELGGRGYRSLR